MARVSRRLGRLGVDYVDSSGKRRWKSFQDEAAANIFLGQQLIKSGRPLSVDPTLTMAEYAPRWLAVAAVRVRPTSLARYRRIVERQILPGLGLEAVASLTQPRLRDWIAGLMTQEQPPRRGAERRDGKPQRPGKSLSRPSAAQVLDVLHQILAQAVDDGIAHENHAKGLSRKLRLTSRAIGRDIKAMTPEQLGTFLRSSSEWMRDWHVAFLTLAMTGMRLGEAFGLWWTDADHEKGQIAIERQVTEDGVVGAPKSHRSRRIVDAGPALLQAISAHRLRRNEAALRAGHGAATRWILCNWPDEGPTVEETVSARNAIRYAMRAVLKRAKLPLHFTPHSFRHTFASIHLSRGEPLTWVSQQLGHESVAMTADLYGRWLRAEREGAAASLEKLIAEKA